MTEVWLPIVGFEATYVVSSMGNVASIPRTTRTGRKQPGVILSPGNAHGYRNVNLYRDGRGRSHSVHRLVAMAFLPNPEQLPQVNHKNGDRADNRVDNLEWCSCSDNHKHAYSELGRKPTGSGKFGALNPAGSRPVKATHLVTGEELVFDSIASATRSQFKFHKGSIRMACRGETSQHFGFRWKYMEDA